MSNTTPLLSQYVFILHRLIPCTIYVYEKKWWHSLYYVFCKMGKNKKKGSFLLLCSAYNIDTMCIIKSYFSSPLKKLFSPPLLIVILLHTTVSNRELGIRNEHTNSGINLFLLMLMES